MTDTGDDPRVDNDDVSGTEESSPQLDLQVEVKAPDACRRYVVVTVSRADVDRYMTDALADLAPKAEVPGFRAGRAPRKLVESRFRKELGNQVKGSLLMDCMEQVAAAQDFSAISEPNFDIDSVEIPDEGPFTFEFEVEVRPEFDLPDWKGLKLLQHVRDFSDEDVDTHLERVLARHATIKPVTTPIQDDSVVTVNFVFEHDGEEISRLNDQTLDVRPKVSFYDGGIEGFAEAIVGADTGEIRSVDCQMSASCSDTELAGKTVQAEVEVVAVKRREFPALTPAFLEKLGGFSSEEELRALILSELQRQLQYRQNREVREQITTLLTAAATWELPNELLKRQFRRELDRAVMELRSSGFSDQEIMTREAMIRRNSMEVTSKALKEHFILERIAEEEGIEAEEADFDTLISNMASREGESPRRVRARLEKRGQMDSLRNQIIEQKVIDLIVSHADMTDSPFEPDPQDTATLGLPIIDRQDEAIPEAKEGGDDVALRTPVDRV